MNALDFHKYLHEGIKSVKKVPPPEIQNPCTMQISNVSMQNPPSAEMHNDNSSIPWATLIFIGIVVIGGIYLLKQFKDTSNSPGYFERIRKRQS